MTPYAWTGPLRRQDAMTFVLCETTGATGYVHRFVRPSTETYDDFISGRPVTLHGVCCEIPDEGSDEEILLALAAAGMSPDFKETVDAEGRSECVDLRTGEVVWRTGPGSK